MILDDFWKWFLTKFCTVPWCSGYHSGLWIQRPEFKSRWDLPVLHFSTTSSLLSIHKQQLLMKRREMSILFNKTTEISFYFPAKRLSLKLLNLKKPLWQFSPLSRSNSERGANFSSEVSIFFKHKNLLFHILSM